MLINADQLWLSILILSIKGTNGRYSNVTVLVSVPVYIDIHVNIYIDRLVCNHSVPLCPLVANMAAHVLRSLYYAAFTNLCIIMGKHI